MKTKKMGAQIIGGVMALILSFAIVFTIIGLASTVNEVMDEEVSKTPDAILARIGIEERMNVSLPVVYYDQKSDACVDMYDMGLKDELRARQFEWSKCDYIRKEVEEGIIERELNEKYLPVGRGGNLTPNKGVADMGRWFNEVENKSKEYGGVLKMNYNAERSEFEYHNPEFYPLDGMEFGLDDAVNVDGHNHLFTMSFAVPFVALYSGEEEVEISADDDTFVFVGKDLVVDMGGIHNATTKVIRIEKNGDICVGERNDEMVFSGVNIKEKRNSILRVFHADRDSDGSEFSIKFTKMDLNVMNVKMAGTDEGDVQIAYDPNDLNFTGPLGESSVFRPDDVRGKIIIATIEGVVVLVLSVLLMSVIHLMFRRGEQRVIKN